MPPLIKGCNVAAGAGGMLININDHVTTPQRRRSSFPLKIEGRYLPTVMERDACNGVRRRRHHSSCGDASACRRDGGGAQKYPRLRHRCIPNLTTHTRSGLSGHAPCWCGSLGGAPLISPTDERALIPMRCGSRLVPTESSWVLRPILRVWIERRVVDVHGNGEEVAMCRNQGAGVAKLASLGVSN